MSNIKKCSFLVSLLAIIVLSSCGKERPVNSSSNTESADSSTSVASVSVPFTRKLASETDEKTGWYYCFTYEYNTNNPRERAYYFIGINMRYRYNDDYWSISWNQKIKPDNSKYWVKVMTQSGVLLFGEGGKAQERDRKVLKSIMNRDRTPEELLALNPDDYSFEVLDKALFFRLMNLAITGEPVPNEGREIYWMLPMQVTLVEPDYIGGYKFQIVFCMKNAIIDDVYIDVLYKTGDAYNTYEQLSDLIDSDNVTSQQKDAYLLLQKIRTNIKISNSFIADSDCYKDIIIDNIDFSRLYRFLDDIDNGNIYGYGEEGTPIKTEEYSEEEYDSLMGE